MEARLSLSADDFRQLVSGGIIEDRGANDRLVIKISLQDIGWAKMIEIIREEMEAQEK